MSETEPTFPKHPKLAARKPLSRWVWAGPLLVVAVLVAGKLGWDEWKHQQFEKERTETPPVVIADLKLKMIWIPAGTFTMGTEKPWEWVNDVKRKYNEFKPAGWPVGKFKEVNERETPATVVTLTKGFYLGETEVTQDQWDAVIGSNPSQFKGPNRPVGNVSWEDCVEFCRKLTQRERAAGRIDPKQVYRLPTEAEWEYACRAGSDGEFCFGNEGSRLGRLEEYAWFDENSGSGTHEVGTKRANAWRLSDMHGNVFEWCADWYGPYPGGIVSDPTGAATGSRRVNRGGCAWLDGLYCCSASRVSDEPDTRSFRLGFRVVLSPIP